MTEQWAVTTGYNHHGRRPLPVRPGAVEVFVYANLITPEYMFIVRRKVPTLEFVGIRSPE